MWFSETIFSGYLPLHDVAFYRLHNIDIQNKEFKWFLTF